MKPVKPPRKRSTPVRRAASKSQRKKWFYVSFASDTAFLGAAFVRAADADEAALCGPSFSISKDAEALTQDLPQKEFYRRVPLKFRKRLLTEREARKLGAKGVHED